MDVLVRSLILVPLIRLWVLAFPLPDFVFVNIDSVVLYPCIKFGEAFRVLIFADTGIVVVIPLVNATYQVFAVNVTVSEQCPAVMTPAVKHRYIVVIPDDHEIDVRNESISRLAIIEFAEVSDLCFRHFFWTCLRHYPPFYKKEENL